jgi:LacI family transcriptional regulator
MPQHVTINQVACEAGVSIQTVSRVINNRYDVAAETRKRVRDAIDRLGYQPNAIARGLASKRSRTLGLVTYDFNDLFFTLVVTGAEEEAHKHNYFFMLGSSQCSGAEMPKYLRLLTERHVDGVLFAREGSPDEQEQITRLTEQGTPVVVVGYHRNGQIFNAVDIDNIDGGYKATKHLIEHGHRHIGCITGPSIAQSAQDRTAGYIKALEEAGIMYDPSQIVEGAYGLGSHAAGFHGMKRLLKTHPETSAVFAHNDRMASGAMSAIQQSGLRVPDDLSVVGYDDTPEAEYASPPLTTIRQPTVRVGEEAVRLLLRLIDDPGRSVEQILMPVDLVVRGSVGRNPCVACGKEVAEETINQVPGSR